MIVSTEKACSILSVNEKDLANLAIHKIIDWPLITNEGELFWSFSNLSEHICFGNESIVENELLTMAGDE